MTTRYWALACLCCLEGLHLGRLVEIDDQGLPVEPHFGGFRNVLTDEWIGGGLLDRAVRGFMVRHLGHKLVTVDADTIGEVLDTYDESDQPFRWITEASGLDGRHDAETVTEGTAALVAALRANRK